MANDREEQERYIADLQAERERRQKKQARAAAPDWLKLCIKSAQGQPLPIVANALLAVEHDLSLCAKFAFDEMRRRPMVVNSNPRPLQDNDLIELQIYLQHAGLKRIGREATHDAVMTYSLQHRYHPLRDWLEGLVWDKTERIKTWATRYLGVSASDYADKIGELFLISMIARVMQPGCKADHMLILEGPQGRLKSMACEVLAGEYFSDNMPDITGKDVSIHLAGKWLIEVSELHAFSRAEATALKQFMSRRIERYRPVYAKTDIDEPRTCVFIGTSNKDAYLRDETGGRRFWPLVCGTIDIDALRADREQLLAEAFVAYQAGRPWWPDKEFEAAQIEPEQDRRYEQDLWHSPVLTHLQDMYRDTVTTAEIANALGVKIERHDPVVGRRIAAIMRKLGWTLVHTKAGNCWQRLRAKYPQ